MGFHVDALMRNSLQRRGKSWHFTFGRLKCWLHTSRPSFPPPPTRKKFDQIGSKWDKSSFLITHSDAIHIRTTPTHTQRDTQTHTHTHLNHTYTHTHTHTHTFESYTHTHTDTFKSYAHTQHPHTHTTHTSIWIIHTHTHTHTHTQTHIHLNHTHTHTHTKLCKTHLYNFAARWSFSSYLHNCDRYTQCCKRYASLRCTHTHSLKHQSSHFRYFWIVSITKNDFLHFLSI